MRLSLSRQSGEQRSTSTAPAALVASPSLPPVCRQLSLDGLRCGRSTLADDASCCQTAGCGSVPGPDSECCEAEAWKVARRSLGAALHRQPQVMKPGLHRPALPRPAPGFPRSFPLANYFLLFAHLEVARSGGAAAAVRRYVREYNMNTHRSGLPAFARFRPFGASA